ncbi:hypothetical protein TKK_0015006 [Trichogramma kaykai]|uniref:Uncharacterized protein n=1 Tax=Trichogramma kaykai TaxID=54128 RepID=A0ABD2WBY3_9HYME
MNYIEIAEATTTAWPTYNRIFDIGIKRTPPIVHREPRVPQAPRKAAALASRYLQTLNRREGLQPKKLDFGRDTMASPPLPPQPVVVNRSSLHESEDNRKDRSLERDKENRLSSSNASSSGLQRQHQPQQQQQRQRQQQQHAAVDLQLNTKSEDKTRSWWRFTWKEFLCYMAAYSILKLIYEGFYFISGK